MNGRRRRVFFLMRGMMTSSEERAIAAELVRELVKELGPMMPESLAAISGEKVCEVFELVFNRRKIVIETVGASILSRVAKLLAKNFKLAQQKLGV
jgi:hypothetical protein